MPDHEHHDHEHHDHEHHDHEHGHEEDLGEAVPGIDKSDLGQGTAADADSAVEDPQPQDDELESVAIIAPTGGGVGGAVLRPTAE